MCTGLIAGLSKQPKQSNREKQAWVYCLSVEEKTLGSMVNRGPHSSQNGETVIILRTSSHSLQMSMTWFFLVDEQSKSCFIYWKLHLLLDLLFMNPRFSKKLCDFLASSVS